MKLLIGGSPCTHWSIAQTKNRETEPSGIGWELFENYLIALAKFQPDYFLYENNKSMSATIQAEITKRFGFEPVCSNSALVSAQNRQRLYWCGKRNPDGSYSRVDVPQPEDKGILLRDILETGTAWREKSYTIDANYYKTAGVYNQKKQHSRRLLAAKPVDTAFQEANYSIIDGANVFIANGKIRQGDSLGSKQGKYVYFPTCEKANTLGSGQAHNERVLQEVVPSEQYKTIYRVENGLITIKGKQYPIKLADGIYIIRKLTVTECKRLQTVPDSYVFPVSDTQAYKMLGNGWTVDVIAHILSYCEGMTAEPLDVLSMYDGMACGHIALDKLGASIARYRATEIDQYAAKTACHNFPGIEQLGDAFQVREW